jgi:hypothetical protein
MRKNVANSRLVLFAEIRHKPRELLG